MQTLHTLHKTDTAVKERKEYLKRELRYMGIYKLPDGRKLDDVSLYTLEWNYVVAKNDAIRAYGEE